MAKKLWIVDVPPQELVIITDPVTKMPQYKSGPLGSMLDFRHGFFPRKYFYKGDAQNFMKEVVGRGGTPTLTREV